MAKQWFKLVERSHQWNAEVHLTLGKWYEIDTGDDWLVYDDAGNAWRMFEYTHAWMPADATGFAASMRRFNARILGTVSDGSGGRLCPGAVGSAE